MAKAVRMVLLLVVLAALLLAAPEDLLPAAKALRAVAPAVLHRKQ